MRLAKFEGTPNGKFEYSILPYWIVFDKEKGSISMLPNLKK